MNEESLKKIRIFAASPSDVVAERAKLRTVVEMLKPTADFLGLSLEVLDWRDVVPNAGRPQQIIFDQLKPTSWDIFIGILWHRFGTPPGKKDPKTRKDYLSGAEEEFRIAYELWEQFGKPRIVMYRCTRPVPQDADFIQAQKVKDFFKEIFDPKSKSRVLTQSFDTIRDFEKLLFDHLQKLLIEYSDKETKRTLTQQQVQAFTPRVADNLPPRASFFGRSMQIKKIMDAISPIENGWGAIIDGIGGIGKTALAVEVAYRCKEIGVFDAFVFITAKQKHLYPDGIKDESSNELATFDRFLDEIAFVLAQPGIAELPAEDKRRKLFSILHETRALLIFDNVETLSKEEQDVLIEWLRFLPEGCKAILTSRRYVGGGALSIRLKELDWEEAKSLIQNESDQDEFLQRIFRETKEDHWHELYVATGGSPLALKWILGLMRLRFGSINDVLNLLQKESLQESDLKKYIYEEAIKDIGANGTFVLFGLSFFSPSATFDSLLAVTNLSRVELEATLERLNALSLVDLLPGEDRYTMHPLTKSYIHQDLNKDPKIIGNLSSRFVRYWADYTSSYSSSSKSYDRLESEWMNLKEAYTQVKERIKSRGFIVEDKDIARLGIKLINSLQPFLLFTKRWEEGMEMDAFGYDVGHEFNIPFLRTFTVESSDERTDISITPKVENKVVSQIVHTKESQIPVSPKEKKKGIRAVDIILKKRDRLDLTREEIRFFIRGITMGHIPDYQAASLLMAILLNGMTARETTDLTLAMAQSGDILDLSTIGHPVVDKHSTGGVGDKTTLVVLPIVAACGLSAGKMSGRGLGFSGGTLDKMESIPGYRVNLTAEEYFQQLLDVGIVLSGQTQNFAPADGKLYALRDVTGSVASIPLIASSIMSKKIACGAQAILFDVKVGLGAFMQTLEEARELATLMVAIGQLAGRKTLCLLSDMNQPLGYAVGDALELRESIETLHGGGPSDLIELCLRISAHMLVLGEITKDADIGYEMARKAITNGLAFNKFCAMVSAQGGDISYVKNPNKLPQAKHIEVIDSPQGGYLSQIHARIIGEAAVILGAGRTRKGDLVDHAVGIIVHHKVGDKVKINEPLFTLHANNPEKISEIRDLVLSAHTWSNNPVDPLPLFYE